MKIISIYLSFIILSFTSSPTKCLTSISDNRILDSIIPPNYDPSFPPNMNGKPVNVDISVSVLSIRSVKETELTYVMDVFYHQYWTDHRLQSFYLNETKSLVLDNTWRKKLWIPDAYFKNALDGRVPDIIFPTQYFVITNTTNVFMASRISLQLSCEMEFSRFPHDSQQCFIDIMSLSHTIDTVILNWKEFSLTKRLYMTQFSISESSAETLTKTYIIGKFSCLRGRVVLIRLLGLYILKNYIPSAIIVIMSFVGFWIPTGAYPARVALVITALLALITQQYQTSQVNVSYIIAINVWMIICITFVFLALIEYAFAITYQDNRQTKQTNKIDTEIVNSNSNESKAKPIAKSEMSQKWFKVYAITGFRSNTNRIDLISRYLFPIGFTLSVIIYLFTYAMK